MAETGTFHLKNFDRLQHYKDRSPPWIKLYNGLLDDYEFGQLPDASKAHLIAIGLLASRHSNKLPLDANWLGKRINATEAVDLQSLINSGFIILDQECSNTLADCKQVAIPERERETEGETETETQPDSRFDDFWGIFPRKVSKEKAASSYLKALETVTTETLLEGAAAYAAQIRRNETQERFILSPVSWLENQRWKDHQNGHAKNSAFNSPEEIAAQKALREKHYGKIA